MRSRLRRPSLDLAAADHAADPGRRAYQREDAHPQDQDGYQNLDERESRTEMLHGRPLSRKSEGGVGCLGIRYPFRAALIE